MIRHVEKEMGHQIGCGLDAILPEMKAASAESEQVAQTGEVADDLDKSDEGSMEGSKDEECIEYNRG